jgi:uncharacterized membrane protein
MKFMYILSALLLVGLVTESTAQTAPRSEFAMQLSKNAFDVKPGTSAEFTVTILRSKTFTRSKGKLGFSSALPEGVTITFEPAEGLFETSTGTITVSENAKAGQYQVIVNAELNRVVKGAIVKISIPERKSNEIVTIN